jgi:hypothetical protein
MITQARLKQLLSYDPETGIFTWKAPRRGVTLGAQCGTDLRSGGKLYTAIHVDWMKYSAHRMAWLYIHGELPPAQIDHIDGNGRNNRLSNLRAVTCAENQQNRRLMSTNSSGFCGVCWKKSRSRWLVQIHINGKNTLVGNYKTIIDAVAARIRANKKHGFHANHGQKRPL